MVACWQPPSFEMTTRCAPSALLLAAERSGQCSEPAGSSRIDTTWPDTSSSSAAAAEAKVLMPISAATRTADLFIWAPDSKRLFDADRAHHLDVGNYESYFLDAVHLH